MADENAEQSTEQILQEIVKLRKELRELEEVHNKPSDTDFNRKLAPYLQSGSGFLMNIMNKYAKRQTDPISKRLLTKSANTQAIKRKAEGDEESDDNQQHNDADDQTEQSHTAFSRSRSKLIERAKSKKMLHIAKKLVRAIDAPVPFSTTVEDDIKIEEATPELPLEQRVDDWESDEAELSDTSNSSSDNEDSQKEDDIFFDEVNNLGDVEYKVPEFCIPIRADVTTFNWAALGAATKFDVIVMDPPWQLASANPTRGVTIGYRQLADEFISEINLADIQDEGFLFVWVINVKYAKTLDMLSDWGYRFIDDIAWVKRTINRRLAKGHGYYLQHAKETCLVAMKGNPVYDTEKAKQLSDVIFSERRGQSQKPEEIYELIEALVPNGRYLEIFGRKNNLRNHWVTIGNEL